MFREWYYQKVRERMEGDLTTNGIVSGRLSERKFPELYYQMLSSWQNSQLCYSMKQTEFLWRVKPYNYSERGGEGYFLWQLMDLYQRERERELTTNEIASGRLWETWEHFVSYTTREGTNGIVSGRLSERKFPELYSQMHSSWQKLATVFYWVWQTENVFDNYGHIVFHRKRERDKSIYSVGFRPKTENLGVG